MPDVFGNPQRQGSSGRISDSKKADYKPYYNERYTCPPDLHDRLVKYATDNERAKSWCIQKALDMWLTKQGY